MLHALLHFIHSNYIQVDFTFPIMASFSLWAMLMDLAYVVRTRTI